MVYFLIPAYNEEETIGLLLYKLRDVMQDVRRDYLAIVLDDGSTDETGDAARAYDRFLPLKVIRHADNRGFGPTLDRLLREACRLSKYPQRDIAITLEADFSWTPEPVPDMVREIEAGADIVIGAPTRPEREDEGFPLARRLSARAVSVVLRSVMPVRGAGDYDSTFRAYRIGLLKRAIDAHQEQLITSADGTANTEILLRLGHYQPSVCELPARLRCDIRSRPSRRQWGREVRGKLGLTGRIQRAATTRG